MTQRKKLIEVALPLEAINVASAREKSIRHGHPSTLHLWWARRPLAAARAVIFASLVDDPDSPDAPRAFVDACKALPVGANVHANGDTPRMRLFDFIERLVTWEATTDEAILNTARELIRLATDGSPPPLLDPFAGGGSIPLEAQRLGLEAHASDLNPVAVMINKAQIEIPPRFANLPPVNPRDRKQIGKETWRGAAGLAADVRYYGEWMRERAWERIGHLYPKYNPHPQSLPQSEGGKRDSLSLPVGERAGDRGGETVIAWLWARTVKSPNPAVNAHVPLVRSFILSKKKGRECWAKPVIIPHPQSLPQNEGGTQTTPSLPVGEGAGGWGAPTHTVRFEVTPGKPPKDGDGTTGRQFGGGRCVISGVPMSWDYIRDEGKAGRMGAMLMAIVTEGKNGRSYYSPSSDHVQIADAAKPDWHPDHPLPVNPRDFKTPLYGLETFADLFTPRQLVALTTFSDLVAEARAQAHADAIAAGLPDDGVPLREGGRGALAYAEAVSVYLAFAVDRSVDRGSTICSWDNSPKMEALRNTFARQAIPMTWDFAEGNPFSESSGNWLNNVSWIAQTVGYLPSTANGQAGQADATRIAANVTVISTDPPYYDNIGYADLSDFFYVWMRKALRDVYPDVFGTLLVPKEPELIASPYRHGGKEAANAHFEGGMLQTFSNIRRFISHDYPLTVYYAFKQQDVEAVEEEDEDAPTPSPSPIKREGNKQPNDSPDSLSLPVGERAGDRGGRASTGWETMLTSLIDAGFSIDGTWPMRTELSNRMIGMGTNALASSIVLVCRPRPQAAPTTSRRAFLDALRRELPAALAAMQSGNIAPVDLAQASIGPGMAIYSRYSQVLEADGSPMSVRTALGLINAALDEYLAEQDGDIDPDTRFAVGWFSQFGFNEGEFGVADVLARAKNTSVAGVEAAGLVMSGRGKVRLVHWTEYDAANAPDSRGMMHHAPTNPGAWDPTQDKRPTVWEATHHLIERLNTHGETGSALLMQKMPSDMAAEARQLAYRLYSICERKGWADHARDYNALVVSWSEIGDRAAALRNEAAAGDRQQQAGLPGFER